MVVHLHPHQRRGLLGRLEGLPQHDRDRLALPLDLVGGERLVRDRGRLLEISPSCGMSSRVITIAMPGTARAASLSIPVSVPAGTGEATSTPCSTSSG